MTDFKEPKRFWSKVDVGEIDECWEWLAGKFTQGYGAFQIHDRSWQAHRVAWALTFGPIPEGLCVCHHCDNRGCCNPYHLFLGTYADNAEDAMRKGRSAKKLSPLDVLRIKALLEEREYEREIARRFGVDITTISQIKRGKTWDWLEEKEKE